MAQITGQLYTIQICNSMGDLIHGMQQSIPEIGIPDFDITFNYHQNKLNVFEYDLKRKESGKFIKEVQIPTSLIVNLLQIKNHNDEIKKIQTNSIENIKSALKM